MPICRSCGKDVGTTWGGECFPCREGHEMLKETKRRNRLLEEQNELLRQLINQNKKEE